MNTKVMFSSAKDDWETPHDLFAELHKEFNFTLDLAAHAGNAKLQRWVGPGSTIAEDLLAWEIPAGETCWMNPPYGRGCAEFIHTVANHACGKRMRIVALLPARTDTKAFHWYIWDKEKHRPRSWVKEVRFLEGRLKFEGAAHSAPFPSMIVVFGS